MQARLRAGISQKELGIRIGMDPGSASGRMNHYEKGRHSPNVDTLRLIGSELGVPLSYFFCDDEINAELVCAVHLLDDEGRRLLIEYIGKKYLKEIKLGE